MADAIPPQTEEPKLEDDCLAVLFPRSLGPSRREGRSLCSFAPGEDARSVVLVRPLFTYYFFSSLLSFFFVFFFLLLLFFFHFTSSLLFPLLLSFFLLFLSLVVLSSFLVLSMSRSSLTSLPLLFLVSDFLVPPLHLCQSSKRMIIVSQNCNNDGCLPATRSARFDFLLRR